MPFESMNTVRAGNDLVQIGLAEDLKPKQRAALQAMMADGDLNDNIATLAGDDGVLTARDLADAGFNPNQVTKLAERLNAGRRQPATGLKATMNPRDQVSLQEILFSRPEYSRTGIGDLPAQLNTIKDPMERDAVIMELATDAAALTHRSESLSGADATTKKIWSQGFGLATRHDESGVKFGNEVHADFQRIPSGDEMKKFAKSIGVSDQQMREAIIAHPDIPINDRMALLQNLGMSETDAAAAIGAQQGKDLGIIQGKAAKLAETMGASTPCQTMTIPTGNGTGTAGVGGRRNVCGGYFQTPNIKPTAQRIFTPEDATKPVVMRFNAVGVDSNMGTDAQGENASPNTLTMRIGNESFEFDVLVSPQGGNMVTPRNPAQFINNPLASYSAETNSLTVAPGSGPIAFEQKSTWVPVNDRPGAELDADEFQVTLTSYNAAGISVEPPTIQLNLEDTFRPDRFTEPDFSNNADLKALATYLKQFPPEKRNSQGIGEGAVAMVDGKRVPTKEKVGGYDENSPTESRNALKNCRHADVAVTFSDDRTEMNVVITASTDHVPSSLFTTIPMAPKDPKDPKQVAASAVMKRLRTENPGMTGNQLLSALRTIGIERGERKVLAGEGVDVSGWAPPTGKAGGVTITLADYQALNAVVP